MKKRIICICIVICVLYIIYCLLRPLWSLDLSRTQEAKLVYIYDVVEITKIIEPGDLKELREILKGVKFKDTPSCGFGESVSIIFWSPEHKEIMVCPACDGCPLMRIGDSDCYIKIKDTERARFDEIVKKYGMVFPCI